MTGECVKGAKEGWKSGKGMKSRRGNDAYFLFGRRPAVALLASEIDLVTMALDPVEKAIQQRLIRLEEVGIA